MVRLLGWALLSIGVGIAMLVGAGVGGPVLASVSPDMARSSFDSIKTNGQGAPPGSDAAYRGTAGANRGPPLRLRISSIALEVAVVSAEVVNGRFRVPVGAVGHHIGSANPGDVGNTVLNGHVTDPKVFAELHLVEVGDTVEVETEQGKLRWVVSETLTIPREQSWYIRPTEDIRLTLYTCEGPWDWLAGDTSLRRVAIAKPAS